MSPKPCQKVPEKLNILRFGQLRLNCSDFPVHHRMIASYFASSQLNEEGMRNVPKFQKGFCDGRLETSCHSSACNLATPICFTRNQQKRSSLKTSSPVAAVFLEDVSDLHFRTCSCNCQSCKGGGGFGGGSRVFYESLESGLGQGCRPVYDHTWIFAQNPRPD